MQPAVPVTTPVQSPQSVPARSHVAVAILNPGRSGFLHLGSDLLLEWRLEAVAHALHGRGIDLCILPGARFPGGVTLPAGFPFQWIGPESTGWDTVGIFIRPELEHAVRAIPEISSSRQQWFEIWSEGTGDAPAVILCALYPAHGGDVDAWGSIVAHAGLLRERFPHARRLLGGDGNLHLSYTVSHDEHCRCLHCRQHARD